MHNLGSSNLKERWMKVRLVEDSFLPGEKLWGAYKSWKEFLDSKKVKWSVLERFINLAFFNVEIKDFHLCLNAPKLEAKVAYVQLLGGYNLCVLPSELIKADFIARARLNDSLTNWLPTQSLYKEMQELYRTHFGNEIPDSFIGHLESIRVISSSMFYRF